MEPVRVGLVGYGFGGRVFHAPLLQAAQECALVGVMTSAAPRRERVAQELPGVPTVGSLAELVDLGAEAVAISTPVATHSALTDEALRRGLAVVCDKPFALDAASARRSAATAQERGLVLCAYQNRRWDSDVLTVRRVVDQGALGTVTRLESRFERCAPQDGPGPSGGGTLLDFGSHLVDQALLLLGPVTSVYAELRERSSGLDDDVFLALTHAGGARSHLSGGWSQHAPGPRFRVTGTDATLLVAQGDTQEDHLVAGRGPAHRGADWGVETFTATRFVAGQRHAEPVERGRWDVFYPAFARAVRGLGVAPVAAADAVRTAVVLDAALRSAASGTVVALDER
ncbi:MAG: putative oxidoreductase [Frankiales bacterium]|nr:putative oxidoreductase [Frankiales bacterium]